MNWLIAVAVLFAVQSCSDDKMFEIPDAKTGLQNDLIKRSMGPNIVGGKIEFAYAMAQQPGEGKIVEASVEASIPGAVGTSLENKSYNSAGSVEVGAPSVTTEKLTKVTFTKDTSAATLRYTYVIPEEARGKSLKFRFSAKSSNGETVVYDAEAQEIRSMDMVLGIKAKDGEACYISIEDMKVYTAAEVTSNPGKVDLIYLYRSTPANFGHALVAPTADAIYLPGVSLPPGLTNDTKLVKAFTVRDKQMAGMQYGVYIDDIDLQTKDFTNAPNFITGLKGEYGAWVQTANGVYRAFIYMKTAVDSSKEIEIGIKRLKLK